MTRYTVGENVEMLIGWEWHKCRIVSTWTDPHYSGQSIVGYRCRFADGAVISCTANSLRR